MTFRIIDARSGEDVEVGRWVELVGREVEYDRGTDSYTDGDVYDDSYRLLSVRPGVLSATVVAELRDGSRHRSRLPIRYLHPAFMFQRVLFIPT